MAALSISCTTRKQRNGEVEGRDYHFIDRETFAEMSRRAVPDDALGAGCLLHANGPGEGGWIAIGYWTSAEARDAFFAERILPAMRAAGTVPEQRLEDLELHGVMAPSPAAVS